MNIRKIVTIQGSGIANSAQRYKQILSTIRSAEFVTPPQNLTF
jgi:hypothetical protein